MAARSRSKWAVEVVHEKFIVIRDVGTDCISVTNDAENVVKDVLHDHGSRRIFYYDSQGDLDELVHDGEKFITFAPLSNADYEAVGRL